MNCKNCEKPIEGNFCMHCGQSTKVRRLDLKYLIHELPQNVFQVDKGFWFTVRELLRRPGKSIREYLDGKRKQHYKPIAFLLLTSSFYVLIFYFLDRNTFMGDLISGFKDGMAGDKKPRGFEVINWITNNQSYIAFIFLPLFSLATYLAYLKSKYNYVEHFVLNSFITGQQMLIYLAFGLIFFEENAFMIVPILLGMFFNIWALYQFFENRSLRSKIMGVVFTYLIFIFEIFVMVFLIAVVMQFTK